MSAGTLNIENKSNNRSIHSNESIENLKQKAEVLNEEGNPVYRFTGW